MGMRENETMRVPQAAAERGSQKWLQQAVARRLTELEMPILTACTGATSLDWLSPIRHDEFAEYRDAAFLDRLSLSHLSRALQEFWPARGPQWDGLARSDAGHVVLVEAKAHIREMCSPPTQATKVAREKIDRALAETAAFCGARPLASWSAAFYQRANRLAHLYFLRRNGIPAILAFVNFVGDAEMPGPSTTDAWIAADMVADYVMGLPARHKLSNFVVHVRPRIEPWTERAFIAEAR